MTLEDRLFTLLEQSGREIKRHSKGWYFLCPYHLENTPSCYLYVDSLRFKCFGCGKTGSLLDLLTAILYPGERSNSKARALLTGTTLPPPQPVITKYLDDAERAALGTALAIWRDEFWTTRGEAAQKYLHSRFPLDGKLLAPLARAIGLGYSSLDAYYYVKGLLSQYEDAPQWLLRIGVEREDGEKRVPRGLRRLIIPEAREEGSIYYQARAIFDSPLPYLSPPAPKQILGMATVEPHKPLVVVEGPMDYLAVRLAGFPCTCLIGGAKLDTLVPLFKGKEVVDGLDADNGGDMARQRYREALLGAAVVRRLHLPVGADPADVVHDQGSSTLRTLIEQAPASDLSHAPYLRSPSCYQPALPGY